MVGVLVVLTASLGAQIQTSTSAPATTDYIVGPQDVLIITLYDQADLTGKFAVETDGTFTFPMIGRVKAGTLTLRQVEAQVKKQLMDEGILQEPPDYRCG